MIPFFDEQPAMFACAIVACILYYNSLRNRSSLRRKAVMPPSQSPWAYLYRNADDSSFLHLTGMSRQAFEKMKDILFDEEIESTGPGRPRNLDNAALLGLYLFFVGSTMKLKWICIQFGIIESTASEAVSRMVELVCRKLKNRPEFKRHQLILSIILTHNFRTHEVGLNQIATVFNPEYDQIMNIEGYDRIARYF